MRHLQACPADLVALPEMPFVDWAVFMRRTVEMASWKRALAEHDAMIERFVELRTEAVVSSRPIERAGQRFNQGFGWSRTGGYQGGRSKVYLPNAPDGWEATWLDRGELDPGPLDLAHVRVGFQLCTEMLFTDLSWRIGHAGAQVIATPRATSGHLR